ncbi:sodium-dependent nutrient amino acid transporter 1-like [Agrilus planipennis]|uniref:Sodium-dependent nutrient amino acid transporter 1 n=1 Tax=Agrilus planipennis TaxID=224129 RepID=A0A1W4W6Y6_AGRPL|nr:sodium-dependent nutrient amino acid transporter 1-like [Agrilus planipennis]
MADNDEDSRDETVITSTFTFTNRWKNDWQFIYITCFATIDLHNIFLFMEIRSESTKNPNVIMYLVIYLTIGMALMYLIEFTTQYTGLTLLQFRNVCPLFHGLGYTSLLNAFGITIWNSYVLLDSILYLINSFQKTMAWTQCPAEIPICWDIAMPCDNCLTNEKMLSSRFYYIERYLKNRTDRTDSGSFPTRRITGLLILWLVLFFFLKVKITKFLKIITWCTIIALVLYLLMLPLLTTWSKGWDTLFYQQSSDFLSWEKWSIAGFRVVYILGIARPFVPMCGTYLPSTSKPEILTVVVVLMHIIVTILMHLFVYVQLNALFKITNSDIKNYETVLLWSSDIHLTFILQGISLNSNQQLLSIMYLSANILLVFKSILTEITGIVVNLKNAFPKLGTYDSYLFAMLVLFLLLSSITLLPRTKENIEDLNFMKACIRASEVIVVSCMVLTLAFIYPLQKFADDVHYATGSQPNNFWKWTWGVLPFFIYFFLYPMHNILKNADQERIVIFSVLLTILLSPILFFAIYEIFRHIKMKYIIGVLVPRERWGPREPDERLLRRLYNPRNETKARRRRQTCKHDCLVSNTHLQDIIENEQSFWKEQGMNGTLLTNLKNRKHVKFEKRNNI